VKIVHKLFETIHPNRWFVWTIALIVMIFTVVWGAIERYAIEQEYSYTGDEIFYSVRLHKKLPDVSSWKTYRNEKYGYVVLYPSTWSLQKYDELAREIPTREEAITFVKEDDAITNPSWLAIDLIDTTLAEKITGGTVLDEAFVRKNCSVFNANVSMYISSCRGHILFFNSKNQVFKIYDQTPEKTPKTFFENIALIRP